MTSRRAGVLASLAVAATFGFVGASCASVPDVGRYTLVGQPNYSPQFSGDTMGNAGVHVFLEKQCGTLDCHGQAGRPLRFYSAGGLRALSDAGNVSGVGADTPDEIYANFVSVVALEPEEISRVVAGQDPPTFLLVVKKPRGLENHKGGVRFNEGDVEDLCLTSWLTGQYDAMSCNMAAALP